MAGREAPGPPGHPLLGCLPELRRDPIDFLARTARSYGPVARYRVGLPGVGTSAYLMTRPDHARRVLQDRADDYPKNVVYSRLRFNAGDGLLTSEGAVWRRQRRAAQPAFHRDRLADFGAAAVEAAASLLDRLSRRAQAGDVIDLWPELSRTSLEIAGRALLGADVRADAARLLDAVAALVDQFKATVDSALPFTIPFPPARALRTVLAIRTLSRFAQGVIDRRRRARGDMGDSDLLSMLLGSRDERTLRPLSDKQLRVELLTFLLAGHETTAVALAWTLVLLSKHRPAARRVSAEIDAAVADRIPAAADLAALPYGRMALDEAMRLYPPSWSIERWARRDDVVDGFTIPAGSLVVLCPYVTHRDPAFWRDPEVFAPERFAPAPDASAADRPRFAYFPFGGGPRACIGGGFASTVAQIVLSAVAQRFEMDLVPGRPVEPEAIVTLRPRGGVQVRLRRRIAEPTAAPPRPEPREGP